MKTEEMKIGFQKWEIKKVDEIDAMSNKRGLCQPRNNTILIADGMVPDAESETVIHEIIHTLLVQSGLVTLFSNSDDEEHVASTLSNGLIQICRDNILLTLKYIYGIDPKEFKQKTRKP